MLSGKKMNEMAKKNQAMSFILGAIVGGAFVYWLHTQHVASFIDRVDPNQPLIISGGGHSIGG